MEKIKSKKADPAVPGRVEEGFIDLTRRLFYLFIHFSPSTKELGTRKAKKNVAMVFLFFYYLLCVCVCVCVCVC